MLNLWKDPWPLDVRQCPCDVHFTDWVAKNHIKNATVFHFGTGDHHHVGKTLALNGSGNSVLGITATKPEYDSYIDLVVGNANVGKSYKVIFTDIYQIEPRLLPSFDVVTLFHLCEFWSTTNAPFSTHDDRGLLDAMAAKVNPGGYILFYTGSFAFDTAKGLIEARMMEGGFEPLPGHESLLVFRRKK